MPDFSFGAFFLINQNKSTLRRTSSYKLFSLYTRSWDVKSNQLWTFIIIHRLSPQRSTMVVMETLWPGEPFSERKRKCPEIHKLHRSFQNYNTESSQFTFTRGGWAYPANHRGRQPSWLLGLPWVEEYQSKPRSVPAPRHHPSPHGPFLCQPAVYLDV